jgi:lipopolysaccharide export system permease protein
MTRVLTRYLLRFISVRLAAVIFVVVAFAFLFDLLDASEDIVGRSATPVRDLLTYTLLRTPSLLGEVLLLATLLGSLTAVADLIRHREVVALWNAGLSSTGLALRVLPLAGLLMVGKYINDDRLIPASMERLRDWGIGSFAAIRPGSQDRWVWMVSDAAVFRFDARAARAHELRDIAIFRRDAEGRLVERILAARAIPEAHGLRLEQVVRERPGAAVSETLPELQVPAEIDLTTVALMTRPANELSRAELARIVAAGGYGMEAIHGHRTWLEHRLAAALAPGLLLLVPFALVRSFQRVGGITPLYIKGLAIGFSYQLANGLLVALGEGGFLAPGIAAWSATLALAAWLAVLLLRAEGVGSSLPAAAPGRGMRSCA